MKQRAFNKSAFPNKRRDKPQDEDSAVGRREALFFALRANDLQKAEILLGKGADPNAKDPEGNTALHIAAKGSNPAAIDLLFKHGANPDIKNKDRFTPFLEAVWNKKPESFLNALLRGGADPDARGRDKKNALHIAVRSNQTNMLAFLVQAGTDLEGRDEDGQTPLHHSLFPLRPDITKVLLDLGADAAAEDKQGETPLMKAVDQKNADVVRDILSRPSALRTLNSAVTHNTRETALHMAVRRDNLEIVDILLDAGAQVNVRNGHRQTPLFLAYELSLPALAERLIAAGADVGKCPSDTRSNRHLIHLAAKDEKTNLLRILIDHGANIQARDENGNTALMLALDAPSGPPLLKNLRALLDAGVNPETPDKWGRRPIDQINYFRRDGLSVEAARMLLEKGADPDIAPDPEVRGAPLHMAARQEQMELMDLLIKAGANLNARDRGDMATPLIDAARFNCKSSARKLLQSGANADAMDGEGRTAMHLAIHSGYSDIVLMLLDSGGDPNITDNQGQTPLTLSLKRGFTRTINAMIAKGARLDMLDKDGGNALHAAAEDNDNARMIPVLLQSEPRLDINAADHLGDTPLMRAVRCRREATAQALLREGADPSRTNKDGESALHLAVRYGQHEIAMAMIRQNPGEAARAMPSGETALHLAVAGDHHLLAEELIKAGTDINAATAVTKTTPLHLAADNNRRTLVELLLSHGADETAVNSAGKTPRQVADDGNYRALVEVFKEAERQHRRGKTYQPGKKADRKKPKPPFDGYI